MKKRIVGKLLAVVLGATMVASAFTGCGKKKTSDGVGADGVVTINLTRACFNVTPDEAQTKKVEDAINDYIKDKIKVKINLRDISSGEYQEKVNLSVQAQEINLLWTAAWEQVIGTNELYAMDAVYDITDLLPGTKLYESMDKGQWEATKYDGKNYYVPVYKDNVEGYDFMFRKDLVDKYKWDITTVKSLKDLEPMLEDCKAEGLKYPYLTQKTAMFFRYYVDDFDFFTQLAIVAVDRETDTVINPIQTKQYKEFCTLMSEWVEKGYLSTDDYTKTTTDTTTQTKDWGISWWTDVPYNGEANTRYGQEVVMQPATGRWAHSTSALGSCYAIMKNSSEAQAKACIDFLGLLYTDNKLADLYTYGIEGEDYKYTDGQVEKLSTGLYNHSMWESVSATIITPELGAPEGFGDLYKAFNGGAETSCAAGFRFDKEPVKDAYAACTEVYDTYGFGLEHGANAPGEVEDAIATYQKALDGAGYQDVLAEFQKQYEEWKKTK